MTASFRFALRLAPLLLLISTAWGQTTYQTEWRRSLDRRWVGPGLWANRLQDWRVQDGRLECTEDRPSMPRRTVHSVAKRIEGSESLRMTVRTGALSSEVASDAATGFLIGAAPELDMRGAALVHHAKGTGAGFFAGIDGSGRPFINDLEVESGVLDPSTERLVPRAGWRVLHVDSVEPESPAENVFDGDPNTIWHTQWRSDKPKHPHEIQIDLGESWTFERLLYHPRLNESAGRIDAFVLYASDDPEHWGAPIALGHWPDSASIQRVDFSEVTARYIRLVARSAHNDRPSTTIAELWLQDLTPRSDIAHATNVVSPLPDAVRLEVLGAAELDGTITLTLNVRADDADEVLATARLAGIPKERWAGNVALVSHPGKSPSSYWFQDWHIEGLKDAAPASDLGPILSTLYTVDEGVLHLSAQLFPLGESDSHSVLLEIQEDEQWQLLARAEVSVPGYTAAFRVPGWDSTRDIPYRVAYVLRDTENGSRRFERSGIIRREPTKDTLVLAALSCNDNTRGGVDRPRFEWDLGSMWFPHADTVRGVAAHEPDLLFFAGDQIYEGASPTRSDRSGHPSSYLDYLYKWYLWCWAYRDLTKDVPAVVMPDDHDVFQGNLWGEGGRATRRDNEGGYVMPAEWVRMVERTQTSHLPDPYDPGPIDQGIGVYFTDLTWGGVGFAILEDRKFKTGPAGVVPPTTTGRPDHVDDPSFDPSTADVEGATLLGERQLEFLDEWTRDWDGQVMKVALSQTVFGGLATHHGANRQYLVADYDSNGWPQSGRRRALEVLRTAQVFMIGGDQHLATICHHGLDDWNDAGWSFCVPAVANFYPRAWLPKSPGQNREPGQPEYLGEHRDGFGNKVTIFATTNPRPMNKEPKALHDGMPGYGIVRFDKAARTITMECWPRFADPSDPEGGGQYDGWPMTIRQSDNDGRKPIAWLPEIRFENASNFLVEVIDGQGLRVYSRRASGSSYRPPVFQEGRYDVIVTDPETGRQTTFTADASTERQPAVTVSFD